MSKLDRDTKNKNCEKYSQVSVKCVNNTMGGSNKITGKSSLSIRHFWGERGKMEGKKGESSPIKNLLSPSPLGRPDTQAIIQLYASKEVKENALVSEGKSCRTGTITTVNRYVCHDLSV